MLYEISDRRIISRLCDPIFLSEGRDFDTLKTGFIDLDNEIGGFRDQELIVIGGRPGVGKSSLALSIIENVAIDNQKTCLYFSLGDSAQSTLRKLIINRVGVDCYSDEVGEESRKRIIDALTDFEDGRLYIEDKIKVSTEYIRETCKKLYQRQNIYLIVIDYLQMLREDGYTTRNEELNAIVRELKALAIEMNCPIILLSSLSRDIDNRDDHIPVMSDLKDADDIEEIADKVILLKRDNYYNPYAKNGNVLDLYIAKNPYGKQNAVVRLKCEYPERRLEDLV